ncbi:MAG TPA: transglutaminase-like domain-containing protein [Chitinophagaceae bacterium]
MEAITKRIILAGDEYDKFFPVANRRDKTIKRNANLGHTVAFIPKVVRDTLYHTEAIAKKLKTANIYDTSKKIWHFVYKHINYEKDRKGFEQIRSPARTWYDRKKGVDCDCYSVFISSILTNLGIPHLLRITKYRRNEFQHIYPVVQLSDSRYITLDCVTDWFDYEVPYSEKKDYPMDLQYLDGFDGTTLGLFGKKKKKAATADVKKANPSTPASTASAVPAPKKKKKGILKKVLNVVNKVNPATLLLRNGVLAAMKLNIKNVAQRLRWSYLSPDKIAQHGIDPLKYQKLVTTRQKLENIFYGAGGKPENLRKAILNGKGNKDKSVSGLGMLSMQEWSGYMNERTPLVQLLGNDIYHSENIEGMEGFQGFGELGEPVTLASVGAAMGVIAGIVAALKQIGSIFKKGSAGDSDFDEAATEAPENNVNETAAKQAAAVAVANAGIAPVTDTSTSIPNTSKEIIETNIPSPVVSSSATNNNISTTQTNESGEENYDTENEASISIVPTQSSTPTSTTKSENATPEKKEGFWDKNKKWLKPVAIGVGGLIVIAVGVKLMKGNNSKSKSTARDHSLSGLPKKRKKQKGKKKKHSNKQAIALL